MSECVNPIDDYSSTLTTTVTTNTSVTKSDTDGTKSVKTSLGNCCNDNNDLLMSKSLRSGRHKYVIIDGKRIRSALAGRARKEGRRVCFPDNDKDLVTGYLEPANPWEHAEDVSRDILLSSYKESCERHCAEPLKKVLDQLEELDICNGRCDDFSLKDESLEKKHCEPLEELFKRIQFRKIDLEHSGLTDESAETLFDMIEYYESAKHVNISSNGNIGTRGWQACGQMIKKTLCLEQLDAKSIVLTQQHMNILRRPLQLVSHLQILKVENCGLAGRAFVILVAALKTNTGLKELYLADNNLTQDDAIQMGSLLRINNCLQLLDISNNNIKDEGVHNILDGLVSQSGESGSTRGLKILILWNNHLSKICSEYFAETIAQSKSLETLNIGHNGLSDDFLDICKDALKHNTVLLQLGVQATGLMNKGIMALAEVVGKNESLQRIDLRDNHIQLTGLTFLCLAMKRNVTITQIDLDDTTWSKAPSMMETYLAIVSEIRGYCTRNDEPISTDSSTEESGSPQHRSRLSSVNSRKISLTCQTLPRSPTVITGTGDTNIRTPMLEPKRTTGGRLRSPAPSPIPSPVASPIPSPSRSRFVVSRVSEASLSSTNSSASSSPITPPSLASSPTCFFPATSSGSSSRFRVTVVESNVPPSPTIKNVVSTSANVTIGFNYRVDMPDRVDSDDSDSVFRSEEEDSRRGSESSVDADSEERIRTPDSGTVFDVDTTITTSTQFLSISNSSDEEPPKPDDLVSKHNLPVIASPDDSPTAPPDDPQESSVNKTLTQALEPLVSHSREPDEPKITDVPKQSSLERLLGLFQNPGTLFTGAFAERAEVPMKNSLQGSVNSMMALGDKFHQYLRDSTRQPLQRSVSDASKSVTPKSDPVKSLSIDQLLSAESMSHCVKPQESVDETQEVARRLSGVQEDDNELDNPRVGASPPGDDAQHLIDHSIDLVDYGNGDTSVPVVYKSEYSIMIGDCEGVIGDSVSGGLQTICDNGTDDSINSCILRDTIVFPIGGGGRDPTLADDVHNLGGGEDNECKDTSDCKLIGEGVSKDDGECESLPVKDCFNDNFNENGSGNGRSAEEDVEDVLASILSGVMLLVDDSANLATVTVCPDHSRKTDVLSTSIEDSVCEGNIVLKVSNVVPTLADDLISDGGQNFGSRSLSFVEELDNPQTSRSPTNLFIDKSINVHRNSQDSGIEEANVSVSDDNLETSPQIRDSFQESLDSGIDSECSSVCTRVENALTFKDSEDKFYDIPEINDQSQSISQSIMIKASVFVNNGEEHEEIIQTDTQMIGDTDMTIIGAKLSHEEQMVSSSTSVE
ncbi:uncharacterized protein LOC107042371 [Diachasma alloeum]|uniref:uncharacterized protein LOC107042371 n=1 Tax=Diachasma alloeum TaxID=454923 RepID=UPI0007384B82|nr:uncharacterized protein LOC107042371 [Diachasma alloeum]